LALLPAPKSWSFDLPPRLKLRIAETITVYSSIVSCITETRWLVELKFGQVPREEHLARKLAIAREYAHKQGKAIKEIVEAIPGAESDAIWAAMKGFADDRDMCAHGVWMVDDKHRPIVVWHSKMLESADELVGEYFDYPRFDHMQEIGRHLLKTFGEFKILMEKALKEGEQPGEAAAPD
jgi:hypothetical protein